MSRFHFVLFKLALDRVLETPGLFFFKNSIISEMLDQLGIRYIGYISILMLHHYSVEAGTVSISISMFISSICSGGGWWSELIINFYCPISVSVVHSLHDNIYISRLLFTFDNWNTSRDYFKTNIYISLGCENEGSNWYYHSKIQLSKHTESHSS